jgi:formate hydrogenlyase transcriptional activator
MSTTLYRPDEPILSKPEGARPSFFETIIGRRGGLRSVLAEVKAVAPTNATVLITGETGTGKEIMARAIHELSPRRFLRAFLRASFLGMNGEHLQVPLLLMPAVLNWPIGTLFLDEIGDTALELQPKLLRVLQEREFERVGSTRTRRVDVRVVAATNRDLRHMVADREFHEDLYYRLNIFPISLPALRERKTDIPEFVRYLVQQSALSMDKTIKTIPDETMRSLVSYPWPGNIRELQNVIERAVILSSDSVLRVALPQLEANNAPVSNLESADQSEDHGNIRRILEGIERNQILAALEHTRWVVAGSNGAAARLGMKRSTLQARMQKLGIVRNARPIEKVPSDTL